MYDEASSFAILELHACSYKVHINKFMLLMINNQAWKWNGGFSTLNGGLCLAKYILLVVIRVKYRWLLGWNNHTSLVEYFMIRLRLSGHGS